MSGSIPFTGGTDGYHTYRIPALLLTPGGTLLAFAEGRRTSGADSGDIDVVARRSTDGGATWDDQRVVTAHGADTAGNPCVAVDPASGDVVLLTCRNGGDDSAADIRTGRAPARRVYVQRSADDGGTWTAAAEISAQARPSWMRWYATGPGAAVALTAGPHAGRLVAPCNHSRGPSGSGDDGTEGRYAGGHSLLSDDGGRSWRLGFTSSNPNNALNEDEATACELPDGRLYFNCRADSSDTLPGNRADAYSADGGETLETAYRPQATLATPVVQGQVLALHGGRLLYSGPTAPDARAAMGLWTSRDAGATWDPRLRVSGLPAAYSATALVDADTVGLLYETGDWSPYARIEFVRVPLADLA
ncbi:sialidase family protein [Streptomyces sp. Z26]|uniref:sialidase family protein n=1 Tax=Streptomyces sp. Z26 TaxID=2500177 RepID=UPI000EF149C6|nr:sialidase family protein [Streptomyces sp. Z26]RLL70833.1 exo-alpha-sialidase [Streptomyces sp. Z26]